jgi:Protein of unknown function (DUF2846).
MLRAAAAALVCVMLAACAATSAVESQSKPHSAQSARIYVVRPGAWSGAALGVAVRVNDAEVGSVANNSYLFVDRPPGRYKIELSAMGALGNLEHEAQVGAGRTYYLAYNAGPAVTTLPGGIPLVIPGPTGGRQVGQANFLAGAYLAELDATAGAEVVARMKAREARR